MARFSMDTMIYQNDVEGAAAVYLKRPLRKSDDYRSCNSSVPI